MSNNEAHPNRQDDPNQTKGTKPQRKGPLADGGDYITMPKWMLLGQPTPARVDRPEAEK